MAYCTRTDILNRLDEESLIRLTDDAGTGSVDDTVVTEAITDADAEIDGYVAVRHPVPLDPVPDNILKYSVDIAIYNLYSRRSDTVPDNRKERYQAAVRYLEGVARGKWTLGADDPEGNPAEIDSPELSSENPERIFTRKKMEGF